VIAPEERTETELLGSNCDRKQIVVEGTLLGFHKDAERCEARLNLAHLEISRHLRESAHETRLGASAQRTSQFHATRQQKESSSIPSANTRVVLRTADQPRPQLRLDLVAILYPRGILSCLTEASPPLRPMICISLACARRA
jgi:hypothetical protein